MPLFDSTIAAALRHGGETLTLRQIAAGSFNTTTQIRTPGATTNTSTYGVVRLVEQGIDGVTVKRGDLEVWLPKVALDLDSVTPAMGDFLVRGSQVLVILELETHALGYYRARARAAA